MKTSIRTIIALSTLFIIAACGGGGSDLESKKAELEKLKAQQAEINAKITVLTDELAAAGQKTESNEKITTVRAVPLTTGTFEDYIDVQGYVDGDENITIMPKAAGPVTKVYAKAGDKVKKDQVLAEIYNEVQEAQYNAAKTGFNLANEMFTRQKALWEKGIGSEMQYLQAKSGKEAAEKQMTMAWEGMDAAKVKAPINGTVDEVNLKVGQMAAPAAPAFRIVNLGSLKVKADVSETYASKIHEGDDVILKFPDINEEVRSKVTFSGKSINPLNRTFGIQASLPEGTDFIPNMIAVVKVVSYRNSDAIVIPVNTLQTHDGKTIVFVAVDEKGKKVARRREVTVGATYSDKAEIKAGLQKGDMLITTGYADLNDGDRIQF